MKIKFTFLLFATALMTACAQAPPADTLDYTAHPDIWPVFKGCETLLSGMLVVGGKCCNTSMSISKCRM